MKAARDAAASGGDKFEELGAEDVTDWTPRATSIDDEAEASDIEFYDDPNDAADHDSALAGLADAAAPAPPAPPAPEPARSRTPSSSSGKRSRGSSHKSRAADAPADDPGDALAGLADATGPEAPATRADEPATRSRSKPERRKRPATPVEPRATRSAAVSGSPLGAAAAATTTTGSRNRRPANYRAGVRHPAAGKRKSSVAMIVVALCIGVLVIVLVIAASSQSGSNTEPGREVAANSHTPAATTKPSSKPATTTTDASTDASDTNPDAAPSTDPAPDTSPDATSTPAPDATDTTTPAPTPEPAPTSTPDPAPASTPAPTVTDTPADRAVASLTPVDPTPPAVTPTAPKPAPKPVEPPPTATSVRKGLVNHWPLEGDANDAMGVSDGKVLGISSFIEGYSGHALYLGSIRSLDLGLAADYGREDPFTIALWYNGNPEPGATIASKVDMTAARRGLVFWVNFDGQLQVNFAHTWPSDQLEVHTVEKLAPVDDWRQVVMTYDGSGKASGIHIYADGKPMAMKTVIDDLQGDPRCVERFTVARRNDNERRFAGKFDEIQVWSRALSDAEVEFINRELVGGTRAVVRNDPTPTPTPEPAPAVKPDEPKPADAKPDPAKPAPQPAPAPAPVAAEPYRKLVNVGGGLTLDGAGNAWQQCFEFKAGGYGVVGGRDETGTSDDPIGKTARYDLTAARFTVPNGKYRVRMLFVDNWSKSSNERVFAIMMEGKPVVRELDVFKQVGKGKPLVTPWLDVSVEDGVLDIQFARIKNEPFLNGIVIESRR
ncbi:MAG: hypothetical protein GC159_01365 [Phycisphaera sp.]|nr:hypothetical protein [Phycisphaera sp.]